MVIMPQPNCQNSQSDFGLAFRLSALVASCGLVASRTKEESRTKFIYGTYGRAYAT
jgi:hypothetical protein